MSDDQQPSDQKPDRRRLNLALPMTTWGKVVELMDKDFGETPTEVIRRAINLAIAVVDLDSNSQILWVQDAEGDFQRLLVIFP